MFQPSLLGISPFEWLFGIAVAALVGIFVNTLPRRGKWKDAKDV